MLYVILTKIVMTGLNKNTKVKAQFQSNKDEET